MSVDFQEQHYLSRVEPAMFYEAPSNIAECEFTCCVCAEPIIAGQRFSEFQDGRFEQCIHEGCYEAKVEDMRNEI